MVNDLNNHICLKLVSVQCVSALPWPYQVEVRSYQGIICSNMKTTSAPPKPTITLVRCYGQIYEQSKNKKLLVSPTLFLFSMVTANFPEYN